VIICEGEMTGEATIISLLADLICGWFLILSHSIYAFLLAGLSATLFRDF